jgi:hypothetical protein
LQKLKKAKRDPKLTLNKPYRNPKELHDKRASGLRVILYSVHTLYLDRYYMAPALALGREGYCYAAGMAKLGDGNFFASAALEVPKKQHMAVHIQYVATIQHV